MPFLFNKRKAHFTYKDHQPFDGPNGLYTFLSSFGPVKWYSFVHEEGHGQDAQEDGQEQPQEANGTPYAHTHVAIEWGKKIFTRNERYFDWNGVHPHIQPILSDKHACRIYNEYHRKAPVLLRQSESTPEGDATLVNKIRQAESLWEACEIAGVEINTVSDVRAIRDDQPRRKQFEHPFPDAIWTLDPPGDFRVLFIHGPTNTGKTQWAVHQFESPLVVSHIDDLGDYNPSKHDGIVFDDMSFAHLPREAVIHLVDWDLDRSIHIRYKRAVIPAKTRKIFTSNKDFNTNFPPDPSGAIRRRFTKLIHVTGPTFQLPDAPAGPEPLPQGAGDLPQLGETPAGSGDLGLQGQDALIDQLIDNWNHDAWEGYLPGLDMDDVEADGYITN